MFSEAKWGYVSASLFTWASCWCRTSRCSHQPMYNHWAELIV